MHHGLHIEPRIWTGGMPIGSHRATSGVRASDQDVVQHVAQPQGGMEVRRRAANYGVALMASGDCSCGGVHGMASPRKKALLRMHYETAGAGTAHHHQGPQAGEEELATVRFVVNRSREGSRI